LHRWLTWFDKNSPPELIEEVVNMDSAIQEAEKKLAHIANDKEALRAYHMREMAMMDWDSGIDNARREEKQEIAKNALVKGIPEELVSEITGLDIDSIKRIKTGLYS
jgi:predicted transposase/invertase (TIGR01784 family)